MVSPLVTPMRLCRQEDVPEMLNVPKILEQRKESLSLQSQSAEGKGTIKVMTRVAELTIDLAAILNLLLVSYERGMKAFVAIGVSEWCTPLI